MLVALTSQLYRCMWLSSHIVVPYFESTAASKERKALRTGGTMRMCAAGSRTHDCSSFLCERTITCSLSSKPTIVGEGQAQSCTISTWFCYIFVYVSRYEPVTLVLVEDTVFRTCCFRISKFSV